MAFTERYVRADAAGGGDGTTAANSGGTGAFTLAEAITHSTTNTGQRYNVMAAGGTFANTVTSRTFSGVATTTAPNWWRGCNTAAGDLDADPVTAKPLLTFTTGAVSITGAHQIFSNLSCLATATLGTLLTVSGAGTRLDRVRAENQNAGANSFVFNVSTGPFRATRCYFKATATATKVANAAVESTWRGCVFTGGGVGVNANAGAQTYSRCVFRATGSHGLEVTAATGRPLNVDGCTFRGCGGDGLKFTLLPTAGFVDNCLFAGCGGWGINNASGTNTNLIDRLGNDFWSNTSGTETGFGDSPSLSQLTEGSDPHASSTDLSLVSGASAKGGGQPGLFESESYTSYPDAGAVQRQEAGGGGAILSRQFLGMGG
jgi:hypothetical protein